MNFANKRILVLEDEPIIGMALEDMLIERGAEALLAATLAEAEALLRQQQPDAAILDVNVHGIESYPLARQLRLAGVPIVFATGYGAQLHPFEFRDVPTVRKPYTMSEIEAALAPPA
jgi:DNA-binding response OmpR family regulator